MQEKKKRRRRVTKNETNWFGTVRHMFDVVAESGSLEMLTLGVALSVLSHTRPKTEHTRHEPRKKEKKQGRRKKRDKRRVEGC